MPEAIIRWILAGEGKPWFPSAHAKETGVSRDSLDEPLNQLREAGLVRVADWVRGVGQGYVLTAEGEAMLKAAPDQTVAPAPVATDSPEPAAGPPSVVDLRPPIVTPALLLANLIWFFVGMVVAVRLGVPLGSYLLRSDPAVLSKLGAVAAPDLLRGEWWRLATTCFVHIGIVHLIVNMIALGTVGPLAELLWGRWRFGVVFAVSGLAGSCLAMALHPVGPNNAVTVLAGASGAIWGVMTSLLVWLLVFRHRLPPALVADWFRRLGIVFVLNGAINFVPGISWQAHLGGAAAGFVAAGLVNALRHGDRPRRVSAAVLLVALPGLCVGGLVAAMKSGESWVPFRPRPGAPVPPTPDAGRLLAALQPSVVRPAEAEVTRFLLLTPAKRSPERKAELRGMVEAVRRVAAEALTRLSHMTGDPATDEQRSKQKAFAAARVKSFDLLLAMLDANTIPDAAVWKAWGNSRREADRLWAEVGVKK